MRCSLLHQEAAVRQMHSIASTRTLCGTVQVPALWCGGEPIIVFVFGFLVFVFPI
jgi:hypothetical protein